MIVGQRDTYLTVGELAKMIGRTPKTIQNWAAAGQLQFLYLCSVPLVSMGTIEMLITGAVPEGAGSETLALELMGRMTPDGARVAPERRRRNRVATHRPSLLSVPEQPEAQP